MRNRVLVVVLAAAAASYAQELEHSTLVGGVLGAASYEAFGVVDAARESSYNVAFHLGADFYRNDGRVTHLVTFDLAATEGYFGLPIKVFDFNYNLPVYFTSGPLRPAVRPFFGARFATSDRGGSLGQLGVLGGVRFRPSPTKCIFSDVYFGWRGRYGSLEFEEAEEDEGWKNGLAFRNANTIEIVLPFCIYVTAALDYDFTKVEPASLKDETGTRKPTFSAGFGPAFFF
ncbi:MAG TPA: hypothetical protein VMX79_05845 [bacterium]|nr:hypothetical protein [bacterium]